jgi:argininosuccinate lyase
LNSSDQTSWRLAESFFSLDAAVSLPWSASLADKTLIAKKLAKKILTSLESIA